MTTVAGALTGQEWAEYVSLVFSRLDEQQRRWVGGLLSEVLGHGGTKQVSELAELDPKTVRQGRIDLDNELKDYPDDGRVRRPGGGRPSIKKEIPPSSRISRNWLILKPVAIPKDTRNTHGAACER